MRSASKCRTTVSIVPRAISTLALHYLPVKTLSKNLFDCDTESKEVRLGGQFLVLVKHNTVQLSYIATPASLVATPVQVVRELSELHVTGDSFPALVNNTSGGGNGLSSLLHVRACRANRATP